MFRQILSRLSEAHNLNPILLATSKKAVTVHTAIIQHQDTQSFATALSIKRWDLYSAVCLERHPVIIKPMQELELKFYNMLKQIEFENSLKCDHELRADREEKLKSQKTFNDDVDIDPILIQTAQDFEDSCQEEFINFKFAPTITEFDKQNISSVKYKLDRNLLLLVHQKIGDTHHWIPPQGIRKEGETMRQTAERVLQDICGPKIKAKFYGNAPIGFYKYKYPKKFREKGSCGAKVFYFLAKYIEGKVADDVKYQWLDNEELGRTLPNAMQKSISQFMLCT